MKDYLDFLEEQNRYCDCRELRDLFDLRRETEQRAVEYEVQYGNADLDSPKEEDRGFLEDCLDKFKKFEKSEMVYGLLLEKKAEERLVYFEVHDPRTRKITGRVDLSKVGSLQEEGFLVTANCSSCETQFDVC